jgi:hypothetical protein
VNNNRRELRTVLAGVLETKGLPQLFLFDPTTPCPGEDAMTTDTFVKLSLFKYFFVHQASFVVPVISHPSLVCTSLESSLYCALVAAFLANTKPEIVFADFKLIQAFTSDRATLPGHLASFIAGGSHCGLDVVYPKPKVTVCSFIFLFRTTRRWMIWRMTTMSMIRTTSKRRPQRFVVSASTNNT